MSQNSGLSIKYSKAVIGQIFYIDAAREKTEKAGQYAYRDRRVKKREFRGLWIVRINAAVRQNGMTYSQFMNGLKKAGIVLDRKVLAEMAYAGDANFVKLVDTAKRFSAGESK